ncbi:MAG: hypothetical protein ACE5GX_20800 [Thermoanaerobaculia bacterium]
MGPTLRKRIRASLRFLVAGAILLTASAAIASPPPRIDFDGNIVRGSRIQTGGEALFVGIAKEPRPFEARFATYAEILVDADHDGVIEFELDGPVSPGSMWAVSDLSSGKWVLHGPPDSPMRQRTGRGRIQRDQFGSLKRLTDDGDTLEFFVARAGVGAWRCGAGDGAAMDLGADEDGRIDIDLGGLVPIGTTEEFVELQPGDIVFAFDVRRLEYSAGRIRGSALADVTDGEGEQ